MYHSLFWFLSKDFIKSYHIKYDYVRHNYFLYRNSRFRVFDCFLIVRTSEKCFRMTYYNLDNTIFYKSFRSAKTLAQYMQKLYEKYK